MLRQQVQIDARLVVEPSRVPVETVLMRFRLPILVLAQQNHVVCTGPYPTASCASCCENVPPSHPIDRGTPAALAAL